MYSYVKSIDSVFVVLTMMMTAFGGEVVLSFTTHPTSQARQLMNLLYLLIMALGLALLIVLMIVGEDDDSPDETSKDLYHGFNENPDGVLQRGSNSEDDTLSMRSQFADLALQATTKECSNGAAVGDGTSAIEWTVSDIDIRRKCMTTMAPDPDVCELRIPLLMSFRVHDE